MSLHFSFILCFFHLLSQKSCSLKVPSWNNILLVSEWFQQRQSKEARFSWFGPCSLFLKDILFHSCWTICIGGYSLCLLNALGSTQSKSGARLPVRAATSLAVSPWLFFNPGSSSACERSSSTVSRELEARQAKWRGVWPPLVTQFTGVVDNSSSTTSTQFHLAAECKGVQPSSVVANGSAPWCNSSLAIWRWLL